MVDIFPLKIQIRFGTTVRKSEITYRKLLPFREDFAKITHRLFAGSGRTPFWRKYNLHFFLSQVCRMLRICK